MRLVLLVCLSWSAVASAEPAPEAPPSKTFERGVKLYDKKDYYSASVELHKVILGESGDSAATVQRAQFAMARALYQMGYYGGSLSWLARIVEAGPGHPSYLPAAKWILAHLRLPGLSHAASYLRAYLGELDQVTAPLDEDARSELFYRLGAELVARGELADARRVLVRVAPGSRYGAHARFELAREGLGRGELAAGVAAAIANAGDPALAAEAARAIAESKYAAGDPAGAQRALQELSGASPIAAFARSRIELAQARKVPSLSGVTVASFETVALATACTRGWADNFLPHVVATVRQTREALDKLLAVTDDNAEIYVAVEQYLKQMASRPEPPDLAIRLAVARAGAPQAALAEMKRELQQLSRSDRAWQTTMIAAEILQELTVVTSVWEADAGKLYQAQLQTLRRDLDAIGQALGTSKVAIPAGPNAAAGRGLFVTDATCAAALGKAPGAPRIAGGPGTVEAPRGRGCAGCASHGDPALALALAWLLTARRGRWRPRARARRRDTAGAATPSRGP